MILLNTLTRILSYHQLLLFIIGRTLFTTIIIIRHLNTSRIFIIIYRKWGIFLLTGRHLLNIIHLMNSSNFLHSRNSIVFKCIILLLRLIVSHLNLLITLDLITPIFQFIWHFVFVALSTSPKCLFYCTIIMRIVCRVFLFVII